MPRELLSSRARSPSPSSRAAYDVELEMLGALVTLLGAPPGVAPAAAPAAPAAEPPPVIADHPWETLEYDVTYRLRGRLGHEAELVHVTRALADGVEGHHVGYLSGSDADGAGTFHLLEGGVVVDDRSVGRAGFRRATIRYPAPLAKGGTHRVRYDTRYGDTEMQEPWFTLAIARTTVRATVRVSFDPAEPPARVWRIDGVVVSAGAGDPDTSEPLYPDGGCVETSFDALSPGFSYGVGWAWPD